MAEQRNVGSVATRLTPSRTTKLDVRLPKGPTTPQAPEGTTGTTLAEAIQ